MNNPSILQHTGQPPSNVGRGDIYLLHATVFEAALRPDGVDDITLGKLVRRRLSRLERVLDRHGGRLVRHLPLGLLASFDTAEAALLIAGEMQRRCASIPQIQETRIGLKIGLHATPPGREAVGEAAAAGLATLHGGNAIVASGMVIDALPDSLRQKTSTVVRDANGLAAHLIDWASLPEPPVSPSGPAESAKPRPLCLTLRQGERSYRFCGEQSVITIGRDPHNDVTVPFPKASRQHCRIICRPDSLVLVDLSTNGTYLAPGGGLEIAIRKNLSPLAGTGKIGFGLSCQVDAGQVLEYEIG